MALIAILEDDPILGEGLKLCLEIEDYTVEWFRDLKSIRAHQMKVLPDLYLLDWNLPDGTGIEWARDLRKNNDDSPVLFITARHDEDSAVAALELGAKDYIRKPFGEKELLARVRNALNEVKKPQELLRFKDLVLEKMSRTVRFRDEPIETTPKEFDLLQHLVERADSVVAREALMEHFDHEEEGVNDRTLDSHVSHLRRKLKNAGAEGYSISAVYGVGYRFELVAKSKG